MGREDTSLDMGKNMCCLSQNEHAPPERMPLYLALPIKIYRNRVAIESSISMVMKTFDRLKKLFIIGIYIHACRAPFHKHSFNIDLTNDFNDGIPYCILKKKRKRKKKTLL